MTDSSRPAVSTAKLEWREDGAPVSLHFDDIYFSRQNGLEETNHVFLDSTRLPQRFASLVGARSPQVHIGETGFGTGLNFLASWRLRDQIHAGCRLIFTSVEKFPLTATDLTRALQAWPQLGHYADQLLKHYPPLTPGWHHLSFIAAGVELNLFIGDALTGYRDYQSAVDAWFLDGFAPAKNDSMWSTALFTEIARLSHASTRFGTFSAATAVRNGLQQAGFEVTRAEGFGRKRHMLTGKLAEDPARLTACPNSRQLHNPWFITAPAQDQMPIATVLGGGLAGVFSAYALARRGWRVELIEQHADLCAEASGNRQSVLYHRPSAQPNTASAFYTCGYLYTQQVLKALQDQQGEVPGWHPCGVLQLASDTVERQRQEKLLVENPPPETLAYPVTACEASKLAGIPVRSGGLFFPGGGWITPAQICAQVANHPNITLHFGLRAARLTRAGQRWQLLATDGTLVTSTKTLILANAADATRLLPHAYLPVQQARGQTTDIATRPGPHLAVVICGKGYIAPPIAERHTMGATFDNISDEQQCRPEDHQQNLANIGTLLPEYAAAQGFTDRNPVEMDGRVGYRCTSPDYLPLVGPVPDRESFISDYNALRNDARAQIKTPGQYLSGLYLSIAHGSKGMASCPLAAELLASYITTEPFPFASEWLHALNPSRFLIRDLKRNRL